MDVDYFYHQLLKEPKILYTAEKKITKIQTRGANYESR